MNRGSYNTVPGSSVLVRIKKLPLGTQEDIYDSAPEYASRRYITNYYSSHDKDKELMSERLYEPVVSINEWIQQWRTKEGRKTPITSAADAQTWMQQRMKATANTPLFESKHLDPYNPNEGIEMFIEGFHNAPTTSPLITICSFNPPGGYYCNTPRNINDVFYFSRINFNSPQKSMRYVDEYKILKGINPYESPQLILDIKSFSINKGVVKMEDCGWSIISLFDKSHSREHVNTGIYMVFYK